MIPGSLARRYARALSSLASSPMQRDKFAKDLTAFVALVENVDEAGASILSIIAGRRYPLSQRTKLLDAMVKRVNADPMVGKFLAHVLEKDRMTGIEQIARAYVRMADEAAGRLQATVTSATPLQPDAVAKLQQALAQATGKTVVLGTKVDPELLGGVVAELGGYVLDGSVRTALQRMRTTLRS
ncbi:MAG TPA: ATP synthase F1 subunit delta [Nannocystaceae bacterium]|nr:ATP synthase F1 subunit delta [Nannocystaceae bacterium]